MQDSTIPCPSGRCTSGQYHHNSPLLVLIFITQSSEDYSYFHLVLANRPPPESTVFGISCNRQIAAADLIEKDPDVSRSIVQKAVVVLASKPIFGPIRWVFYLNVAKIYSNLFLKG